MWRRANTNLMLFKGLISNPNRMQFSVSLGKVTMLKEGSMLIGKCSRVSEHVKVLLTPRMKAGKDECVDNNGRIK